MCLFLFGDRFCVSRDAFVTRKVTEMALTPLCALFWMLRSRRRAMRTRRMRTTTRTRRRRSQPRRRAARAGRRAAAGRRGLAGSNPRSARTSKRDAGAASCGRVQEQSGQRRRRRHAADAARCASSVEESKRRARCCSIITHCDQQQEGRASYIACLGLSCLILVFFFVPCFACAHGHTPCVGCRAAAGVRTPPAVRRRVVGTRTAAS